MAKGELKYRYVYDETGRVVDSTHLTKQSKVDHKYYIQGYCADLGKDDKERVVLHICTKTRNYFSRYPKKSSITPDGEKINRVDTPLNLGETLVHKLAKQLFIEDKIGWICLPNYYINIKNNGRICIDRPGGFKPTSANLEKVLHIDDKDYIKVDIELENNLLNTKLLVEIKVRHGCDEDKIEKIKKLGIDTIEIDLSSLTDLKNDTPVNLEEQIIDIITKGTNTTWIYNREAEEFKKELRSLVVIDQLKPSNYSMDGSWYCYKDTLINKISHCVHMESFVPSSATGKDRYITESQCLLCKRYIGKFTNKSNGSEVVLCNQSDMSNNELLTMILKRLISKII